jgi:pyridoxine/pyridoxamine 5'-phosphate oxidase
VAELRVNPRVAATFYWHSLGRQARVEGRAEIAELAAPAGEWRHSPLAP